MRPTGQYDTARLTVFTFAHVPQGGDFDRETHVGWRRDADLCYPVVVLTLWGNSIEMIWVHDFFRRQGFAREIIEANGRPHGDGVSYEGACLVVGMGIGEDARDEEEINAQPIPTRTQDT